MSNVTKTLTVRYRQEGGTEMERMAKAIARAQQTVAEASDGAYKVMEGSERRIGGMATSYRNLTARLDGVTRASKQFHADLRDLQRGLDAGVIKGGEFARRLDQIKQNLTDAGRAAGGGRLSSALDQTFDMNASNKSARDSASALNELITAREAAARAFGQSIGNRMGFDQIGRSAEEASSSFDELIKNRQRVGEAFRAGIDSRLGLDNVTRSAEEASRALKEVLDNQQRVARSVGADINTRLVAPRNDTLASDSAKAFEPMFRKADEEAAAFESRLARIIAEIDPLTTAQARYNTELAEYQALADKGYLSAQQLGQAQQVAAQRFEYTSRALAGVGSATKLSVQGMQNMQYQLNDIAVSLMSGQSPFTVIMQQGAQMAQEFGPGASVSGALKSVGQSVVSFLSNPLTLAVAGFAAVAGAASLIYNAVQSKFPPIQDRIDRQKKAVEDLADRYRLAAEAAKGYADQSGVVLQSKAKEDYDNDLKAYKRRADELKKYIEGVALSVQPLYDVMGNAMGGADMKFPQISGLLDGFNKDDPESVKRLIDQILRMAEVSTDPAFKAFAAQIRDDSNALAELGARLRGTSEVLTDTARQALIMKENFKAAFSDLTGLAPAATTEVDRLNEALQRAMKNLAPTSNPGGVLEVFRRAMDEINRPSRESLRDVSGQAAEQGMDPREATIAAIKREYAARIEESDRLSGSTEARLNLEREMTLKVQMATEELRRTEEARTANHELDIKAIGARGAAQLASIEAERTAITLREQGYNADEIARRSREAADLSLAQSTFQQSESARLRLEAQNDNISSIQTEMQVLGKSAGETARLTTEYQLLLEAKKAAYQEGRDLGEDEIDQIKRHAAEVGKLTDALAQQKLAQDATFDRSQLFRSDEEASARSMVKGAGVDPDSAFGKQAMAYDIATQRLTEYRDLNREVWQGIASDIANGVKPVEALGNALKSLAGTLLQKSVTKLSDSIFGGLFGGQAGGLSAPLGIGALGSSAANPMYVTFGGAAGGVASLLGGTGSSSGQSGGAVGAITKLLNPGNDNAASTSLAGNSVKAQVANYFADKGLAPHQIAGILGNVSAESAFNPTAVGDAGQAFGLFQHNDRKNNLFASIGGKQNLGNVQSQLDFAWKELQTTENPAFKRLLASKDVRGATEAFAGFERPRGFSLANPSGADNFSGRLSAAEKSFKEIEGSAKNMASSTDKTVSSFAENATSLTSGLGGTFASLDSEMLRIANDFTPAFGGALQSVLNAFASSLGNKGGFSGSWVSALASSITGGMTGAPGGGDAWAGLRLAGGGAVSGAGSATSDSIPAMLSNGEFVVNAHATAMYRPVLDAINEGRAKRLAGGGYVAPSMPSNVLPMQASASPAFNGNVTVVNPPGVPQTAEAQLQPDGSLKIMMRQMVAEEISTRGRPANNALRNGFGAQPTLRRR